MVQLKLAPVETKNLFSRHYLEERLKTLPVWSEGQEEFERAYREIKGLYEKEKSSLQHYEEAQLEENFIKPVLRILGHIYEVQQTTYKGGLTPDYAFFKDDGSRREALRSKGKKEFYTTAVAVGDAKKWGTPLDKKSRGKAMYVYDNPSYQIDVYLRDTDTKWAILTDGRFWRLYNQKSSYRLDSYYQVDLADILEKDSKSNFKYFYLFFRRDAFLKDESGLNFLEQVYAQGVSYAKKVGEDLEKNVYKALKIFTQGFLNWPSNNLSPDSETIEKIHDNSLIFLYRLLFILYADSRGTLSGLRDPSFAHYDINRIRTQAITRKREGTLSVHSSELWDRLSALFQLIDEGSEARGIRREELFVPPYNGGLFHAKEHQFLAEKKVGDMYVADVLELLTVPPDEDEIVFIDYSTLEIRHLGSIYEGLLEYKLRVADRNLVAVKQKGKEIWIPEEDVDSKNVIDTARAGELYLVTDKGERKATGSYYTPDYIVKYIVENTIGPLVEERLKDVSTDEEKIARLLSIKILDPAMGSGHFLVEATEFLAGKIVPYVKPEQLGDEKEIEWARREVVKRCIYGVDLNHLATELAKLSLWLGTLEAARPLSFLDHHLKVGNSLIGADIHKLDRHPSELKAGETTPQLSLSTFMRASIVESIDKLLTMYNWIVERAEEKIADIKYKEQVFEQLLRQPLRRRFVELANLHASYYFGNEFTKDEYEEALRAFQDGEDAWNKIRKNEYFKRTQEIANGKNFFHWKLEFPEIFFEPGKEKENPGFDVVIGNPPYDVLEARITDFSDIEEYKKIKALLKEDVDFYRKCGYYRYSIDQKLNLYRLFIERSGQLLNLTSLFGYIIPSTLLADISTEKIRDFLIVDHRSLLEVNEFPEEAKLFPDVTQSFVVFISSNKIVNDYAINTRFGLLNSNDFSSIPFIKINTDVLKKFSPRGFVIPNTKNILELNLAIKIHNNPYLKHFIEGEVFQGEVNVNSDKAYIRDHDTGTRLLRGDKISKFSVDLTFDYSKGRFLEKELFLNDKKDAQKAFHYKSERIAMKGISNLKASKRLECGICPSGTFLAHSTNYIFPTINKYYFISVLNSLLLEWRFRLTSSNNNINSNEIEALPIRRISFTTPESERTKLASELKDLYNASNFNQILSFADSYLPKDSSGNFITEKEKSDVVHDFLAYLAEQMIGYNKQKNNEINGFLSWLEREINAKIEDLSNKTAIKEYYNHSFENLIKVLKKNRHKLAVDPSRRELQDKLKVEFESSTAKLKPLIEKIERTDWLIDQIVYKLYGLAEDEIKIVEASFTTKSEADVDTSE